MHLSAFLSLAGNVLEFAGAIVLVLEIVKDSREVRKYLTRGQTVAIGTVTEQSRVFGVTGSTGLPATLDQRVAALEQRSAQLQENLEETKESLRAEWKEDLSALHDRVNGHVERWNRALESLLLGVTKGSLRRRIVGATLVVIGIAMDAGSAAMSL